LDSVLAINDYATAERFERLRKSLAEYEAEVTSTCWAEAETSRFNEIDGISTRALSSDIAKDKENVPGVESTTILLTGPLFSGSSRDTMFLKSRHEVIQTMPAGFQLPARSEISSIAEMKHEMRPFYGFQFHPEHYASNNPIADRVIRNFARLLR